MTFRLLIHYSHETQRRRPIGTVFEILVPCILIAILYLARSRLAAEREPPVAFASRPGQPLDVYRSYINTGNEASGIFATPKLLCVPSGGR